MSQKEWGNNNRDKKNDLAEKVELAYRVDNMKTRDNHATRNTCSECKKSFEGPSDSKTCSDKCRKRRSRG